MLIPKEIIHQFILSMRRELDLAGESRNAEKVAAAFSGDPTIVIPKVYWELTSERMNVQQYIDGIAAYDLAAIDNAGMDRKKLAHDGANIVMKMVLEDGFFMQTRTLAISFFCLIIVLRLLILVWSVA